MRNFIFFVIGILGAFYIYFSWYVDMETSVIKDEKALQEPKITTKKTQNILTVHEEQEDDKAVQVKEKEILTKREEITQSPQKSIEEKEDFEENIEEFPIKSNKTIKPYKTTNISTLITGSTAVKMKIRAREKDGIVKAKVSIIHDMLTPKQAEEIEKEANFITYIVGIVEEKVVFEVSTSQYLSKNPLLTFTFKGKRGNMLTIVYRQLDGISFMASTKIK